MAGIADCVDHSLRAASIVAIFIMASMLPSVADAQLVRNTVGLHGTYATIQAGIDACGPGVTCSVDVEVGTYVENLSISASLTAASIAVSGGWDAGFASQSSEPAVTTIDGGGFDRVIEVRYPGQLSISGFTITGGSAVDVGGGVWIFPTGASNASTDLTNLRVVGNLAVSAAGFAQGGGVHAQLDGSESFEMVLCTVFDNTVSTTGGSGAPSGGGVSISASGTATFRVEHSWIEYNEAASDTGQKRGAGQFFSALDDSSGELIGVMVSENAATGAAADVVGSGGQLYTSGNGQITVRRSAWTVNGDTTGDQSEQLRLSTSGASSIQITDSAVALGDGHGLVVSASDTSTVQLTNLTTVDNIAVGILVNLFGSANASLYNSIAYGNGTDTILGTGVAEGNNLVGVDPHFMDPGPPGYNYRLDIGSPGLDAGTNAPPGGIGTEDLDARPRVENGTVDIGCYEGAGMLFFNGFEGGGTGEWDATSP